MKNVFEILILFLFSIWATATFFAFFRLPSAIAIVDFLAIIGLLFAVVLFKESIYRSSLLVRGSERSALKCFFSFALTVLLLLSFAYYLKDFTYVQVVILMIVLGIFEMNKLNVYKGSIVLSKVGTSLFVIFIFLFYWEVLKFLPGSVFYYIPVTIVSAAIFTKYLDVKRLAIIPGIIIIISIVGMIISQLPPIFNQNLSGILENTFFEFTLLSLLTLIYCIIINEYE